MPARPRLTYANVVSTLALVIALSTGGAYAAGLIQTRDIADEAVTTAKLRDGAATTAKIHDGAVKRAKIADNAVNGAKVGDGALTGADIANGSVSGADLGQRASRPSAFALITSEGAVYEDAASSGITTDNISRVPIPDAEPGEYYAGVYCLHDLAVAPATVSATPSFIGSGPAMIIAALGAGSHCPPGTDVSIKTYFNASSPIDASFYLQLWE